MSVGSTTGTTGTSNSKDLELVDPSKAGFNGLDSQDFLKLLVTQLQNQDPTQPVGNEELLNQLSAMRSLQSNIELENSLKSLTLGQSLSSGASFLGKEVGGVDDSDQEFTGVVDRIIVRDGTTYVGMGDAEVPISKITTVNAAS